MWSPAKARCTATWWLCLAVWMLSAECEAQNYKQKVSPRRKKQAGPDLQFGRFLNIIKYTFAIAIAPLAIFFIYTVATDPDLPRVLRYLWTQTKKKWLSYLGKKNILTVEPVSGGAEYDIEEEEDSDNDGFLSGAYSRDRKSVV